MQKVIHTFEFLEYNSSSELPVADQQLLETARQATSTSYAPYSHYHVGAAVRLANGKIFSGSNQENMAFPVGLCAERVAVFAASSNFPEVVIEAIAVTAKADNFEVKEPVPPCGMCRQAIVEYEMKFNHPIRIILGGEKGKVIVVDSMDKLLPFMFRESGLLKSL